MSARTNAGLTRYGSSAKLNGLRSGVGPRRRLVTIFSLVDLHEVFDLVLSALEQPVEIRLEGFMTRPLRCEAAEKFGPMELRHDRLPVVPSRELLERGTDLQPTPIAQLLHGRAFVWGGLVPELDECLHGSPA